MPIVKKVKTRSPYLVGPALAVAVLFVALPIIDTFSQTWPITLSSPGWRFGTIGIASNYLVSVLFGMFGVCVVASLSENRLALRVLAVVCGAATVFLLFGVLAFLLDAVQVRAGIPASEARTRSTFDLGAAKAAFKYVLSAVVMGWLALETWRRAGAMPYVRAEGEPALVSERRE